MKRLEAHLFGKNSRIVIRGGRLDQWNISISGPIGLTRDAEVRADAHLLTGCLTLVDIELTESVLSVDGGACEDGLNIIRGRGTLKHVDVTNSDQDAIDLDFSKLVIRNVLIREAGNDCLDVSAGTYDIEALSADSCGDKAISVGEGSELFAQSVEIGQSTIGIAAKDSSTLLLGRAVVRNSPTCVAAYRKKPEFDGALVSIELLDCERGRIYVQKGSSVTGQDAGSP